MKNRAPLTEGIVYGEPGTISLGWISWFSSIFLGIPWNIGLIKSATLDFPSIAAQSQDGLTVTVAGVRAGDSVQVTPTADVSGIVFTGVVTASNTVTVYAKNYTAGAINPASQLFKIIALQS